MEVRRRCDFEVSSVGYSGPWSFPHCGGSGSFVLSFDIRKMIRCPGPVGRYYEQTFRPRDFPGLTMEPGWDGGSNSALQSYFSRRTNAASLENSWGKTAKRNTNSKKSCKMC